MVSTYSTMNIKENVYFNPRKLKYIALCDEIPSLSCITDLMVEDLTNEGTPQIYALCGRSNRSSLRVLKHGLTVSDMASSSLPGKPLAIWTLKSDINDVYDKYVIVSFQNATLALSIEDKVREINTTGFDLKKPSLHVNILLDNTFIQVLPNGIIHIKADKKRAFYQTSSKILAVTSNNRQIATALQDKEIIYFELQGDKLEQIEKKVLDSEILSLDIGPIPEGRNKSKFLVVGCADNSIRILSLDIDQCLSRISMQMLPAPPESVLMVEMGGLKAGNTSNDDVNLFLFVGLNNGVLMKTSVDPITGTLSDTRTKYLGSRSVSLFKSSVEGKPAVIASSSRPWLCYNYMGKYYCTNLNTEPLDYAGSFTSEQCSEGIVAISENFLRIFSVERYGEIFNQTVIPLRYTPRKMVVHPDTSNIIIIESDQNVFSKREKDNIKKEIAEKTSDEEYPKLKEDQIGVPFAGEGRWASCIRMLEPYDHKILDLIEFEDNEAALSAHVMTFSTTPGEMFLIVGTAKDMKLHPRSFSQASIIVFAFKDQGKKVEFMHRVKFN
jgi:splicing factor 3B subunit 3